MSAEETEPDDERGQGPEPSAFKKLARRTKHIYKTRVRTTTAVLCIAFILLSIFYSFSSQHYHPEDQVPRRSTVQQPVEPTTSEVIPPSTSVTSTAPSSPTQTGTPGSTETGEQRPQSEQTTSTPRETLRFPREPPPQTTERITPQTQAPDPSNGG